MMSIRSSFSGQGINSKMTGLKSKKFQLRHTHTHKHTHRNQIETSQWTHKFTNMPGEREIHVKQSEITVARVVIKLNNSQLKRMHDDSGSMMREKRRTFHNLILIYWDVCRPNSYRFWWGCHSGRKSIGPTIWSANIEVRAIASKVAICYIYLSARIFLNSKNCFPLAIKISWMHHPLYLLCLKSCLDCQNSFRLS